MGKRSWERGKCCIARLTLNVAIGVSACLMTFPLYLGEWNEPLNRRYSDDQLPRIRAPLLFSRTISGNSLPTNVTNITSSPFPKEGLSIFEDGIPIPHAYKELRKS